MMDRIRHGELQLKELRKLLHIKLVRAVLFFSLAMFRVFTSIYCPMDRTLQIASFGLFSVFSKQTLQFLQQCNVKNVHTCPSAGIRTHNLSHLTRAVLIVPTQRRRWSSQRPVACFDVIHGVSTQNYLCAQFHLFTFF